MRSNAVASVSSSGEPNRLQQEILAAHESLRSCFREMEEVLAKPAFDASALTSVRLKLAGLRLTRGPLIMRVAQALVGKVTDKEAGTLAELQLSHQRLLQSATAHTNRWTLEAIAANWPQYRDETREQMRNWLRKAELEQRLVYPLVGRCGDGA